MCFCSPVQLLAELYGAKTLSVTLHRPGRELLFDQREHNLAVQKFKVPFTPHSPGQVCSSLPW